MLTLSKIFSNRLNSTVLYPIGKMIERACNFSPSAWMEGSLAIFGIIVFSIATLNIEIHIQ
jgi:hypothetical protein